MSYYNQQGAGRAKDGVIQHASYAINKTNSNDTMGAIKTVAGLYRASKEAILTHEAEKNKKADGPQVVTAEEIRKDLEEGLYR